MRRVILSTAFLYFALGAFAGSAAAQTFPYDHIHVNVPDPAAAANWYEKYFGGRRITEARYALLLRRLRTRLERETVFQPNRARPGPYRLPRRCELAERLPVRF